MGFRGQSARNHRTLLPGRVLKGAAVVLGLSLGLLLGLSLGACSGLVSDPAAGPTDNPPQRTGPIVCDPGNASVAPLRRLSAVQYQNTLRDLFAPSGIDVDAESRDELARLVVDDASDGFRRLDARLSGQHLRGFMRVADRLATVAQTDLAAFGGDCAIQPAAGPECVDAFLDDFGMRAYRRPLSDEERTRYHGLNDGTRDGPELFRSLIFSILLAPQFLNHVELDGPGDDANFELGPFELASRLSYHFWQSMPDEALFAAAAAGELTTDEGFEAQLDRVIADPRTRDTIATFYGEWFGLGWLGSFPSTAGFETFTNDLPTGTPGPEYIAAANDEVLAMTQHFTFDTAGGLSDLLLTDLSFTTSAELAAAYGVQPWDGESALPVMPAGERSGILTRVAFLLSGTHETHPIHRGAEIRQNILCDPLPAPDPSELPADALTPPPQSLDLTTRQRFENKTGDAPCNTCHAAMNPIGFVLERYDGIGRYRTEELVVDDQTGEVLARLPIDSASAPAIGSDPDAVIETGEELSQAVVESGKTEACFARQYFRFAFGREETSADGCALDRVRSTLLDGGSLLDALRSIALDPMFRTRRVM